MPRAVRYRVLRKIAHGGMAEIFLALQTGAEGFKKPVVLKRILPAFAADPHFVRMLVDEAHIASSLSHSHLVQVLDLGKSNGQFFLVLEFVDGWSLEQVRRRAQKARMKIPLPLSLHIVASLCRALGYVHERTRDGKPLGIVHRDVSPQNVLLGREGEVKLADFGIAKAVGRREKSATGIIKGKFAYMSPEQSIGSALDARSDLFSVGTLLYILTTGRKPFDAPTDLEVLMQVRRARYEKPSELVRDFNPEVERFIARALRADRARRWQSAEQMADRLDAILVKLGQASGPAVLKRWLEALSARDGVPPPGDMGEDVTDAAAGTIELETDDLELRDSLEPRNTVELHDAAAVEISSSLPRAVNAGGSSSSPPPSSSSSTRRVDYASVSVRRVELSSVPDSRPDSVPDSPHDPALSPTISAVSGSANANAEASERTTIDADGRGDTSADADGVHEAPTRPVPAAHLVLGVPEFADPDLDDDDVLSMEVPIYEEEPISPPGSSSAADATGAASVAEPPSVAELASGVSAAAAAAAAAASDAVEPSDEVAVESGARPARRGRRWAVGTLLFLALVAGGAYFARPYVHVHVPPQVSAWVVQRVVQPGDAWLRRLPARLDRWRHPAAEPGASNPGVNAAPPREPAGAPP